MTHEEASQRAVIAGTVNAALETFPTFEALGWMAKGSKLQKQLIADAFVGASKKYSEPIAKTAATEFALNTLKGATFESGEETLQNVADDLMLNDIEKTHPGTVEGGIKSYGDIATDALGAFVASYPTSLLFGAAEGLGAGAFSTSRYAAQRKQIRAQEKIFGDQIQNTAIGNALAGELQDAVQNSKLKDTAPDVQRQLIKEKAAGTGFEIVYIDTEMAMEKEGGRKDLEAVAKAANISEEDLQTAIDEKGTLAVPLECFAQAESSPALLESASYKTEAQSIARMKKEATETIQRLKEADQKHLDQLKNMVDVVAEEYFPADENDKQGKARQDMAKAIIMTFAENPAVGWNEMMKMVQGERTELLQSALDYINETSGNGTVVIPTEDGKGFRASNNAHWYSKWAKEHNYRAMTKADKEELAEEMVRGNAQIGDFRGPAEAFAENGRKLDEINGKIKALEEIKDKMKELNGVEMKLTEGLSKEGFAVYRAMYEQLKNAPGYVSRGARMDAIIYARRADIVAGIMQKNGHKDYTAKDYFNTVAVRMGGTQQGMFNQEDFTNNNQGAIKNPYLATEIEKYNNIEPVTVIPNKIRKTETKGAITVAVEEFKKLYPDGKKVDTVIGQVVISHRGIHNSFGDKHTMYQSKLDAVLTLVEGMEKAAYIGCLNDLDGKNTVNHYFAYPILYAGEKKIVVCRVRKTENSTTAFYIHEVFDLDRINKTSQSISDAALTEAIGQGLRGPALIKNILADFHRKIKEYTYGINNNSPQINGSMYQMAGEQAKTAALDKLEQAKAMETEGKFSDEIFKETGWLKGKDDKWRFEIPDNLGGIHAKEFIEASPATRWPLGRLYENDALYEAYPFLRNVQVILSDQVEGNANGVYDPHANIISINYRDGKITPNDLNGTLIHEIQHVIQGKEGFASGGSVDTVIEQIETRISNLVRELESGLVVKDNSAVELDELLKQRGDLIVKSNNAVFDGKLDDVKAVEDERKVVENQIQELLPNRNLNEVFKIDGQIEYLEQKLKEYHEAKPGEETNAVLRKLYQELAGEQEARKTRIRAEVLNEKTGYALEADKKAGQLSLAFEKEYLNSPDEVKELLREYMQLEEELNHTQEQAAKDEILTKEGELEKRLNETEPGSKLLYAYNESWFADFAKEEAWDNVKEYSDSMPQPHSYDAIVVFNGISYSAENAEERQKADVRKKYEGTDQWMKAPNGKDTNLTEDQWLAVRTPAFKKWFGDWETVAESMPVRTAETLDEAKEQILPSAQKEITNDNLGITVVLSKKNIGKMTSEKAHIKSTSAKAHAVAVANVDLLFKKAEIEYTHKDRDNNPNYKMMHRVFTPFIMDGQIYVAKMTVKEMAQIKENNPLYSVESLEIKEASRIWNAASISEQMPDDILTAFPQEAFNNIISRLQNNLNNSSKVIDENGEPLVVYHGTKRGMFADRFNTFEGNGKPIWHSSSEEYAKLYFSEKKWNERGDIYTDFLNIKNPIDVGNVEFGGTGSVKWLAEKLGVPFNEVAEIFGVKEKDEAKARLPYSYLYEAVNSPEFIKWAQNKGYDGIIEVESGNSTYGVFKPNQIKSAVANNGNYDGNDPNIYHQGIKGSITPMSNGQRIINIFESADESTFLHEMGHLFLLDLEELAQIDERSAKELATVTEWAAYKKEDVKGYKGTPFEGEFLKLAADIEAAEKNGDVATAEQLKRKWMHERFARGFEMYLEFGQAPSTGLKSVFRKFKQFLTHIYIGLTGEGVRATPEVERVMARMIASDAEIEAAALSDRYKDITKAGGEKLLTETETQTMARWHEEAKEEAKEKLLAIIMKDLEEEKARDYQASMPRASGDDPIVTIKRYDSAKYAPRERG